MKRTLVALAVTAVASGWAGAATAQPGTTSPGADDPAWALYDRAFEHLASGERAAAERELAELVRLFPEHPAAARARTLELSRDLPDATADAKADGAERPTRLARAELAFWMTLHGVLAGLEVRELADLEGARPTAGVLMAGGALGLGASLFASRDGIRPGTALLLDSAITWGAWNSLVVLNEFPDDRTGAGVSLAGQALGLGAGLALSQTWRPTAGDVSLANTAGFWTTILTLLGHGIIDVEPEARTIALAGDAGLVLGALVSSRVEMSRGRTLLLDAGGVLGFLAGGLVAVIVANDSNVAAFTPMFLGTAGGLALASYTTRDWDAPEPPAGARLGAGPIGEGGFGAIVAGRW